MLLIFLQKNSSILGGPFLMKKIKYYNCIMTKRKKWSNAYKKSINCKKPKGFSQKQYCKYGRNKTKMTIRIRRSV
jgi:hypothetical protein